MILQKEEPQAKPLPEIPRRTFSFDKSTVSRPSKMRHSKYYTCFCGLMSVRTGGIIIGILCLLNGIGALLRPEYIDHSKINLLQAYIPKPSDQFLPILAGLAYIVTSIMLFMGISEKKTTSFHIAIIMLGTTTTVELINGGRVLGKALLDEQENKYGALLTEKESKYGAWLTKQENKFKEVVGGVKEAGRNFVEENAKTAVDAIQNMGAAAAAKLRSKIAKGFKSFGKQQETTSEESNGTSQEKNELKESRNVLFNAIILFISVLLSTVLNIWFMFVLRRLLHYYKEKQVTEMRLLQKP